MADDLFARPAAMRLEAVDALGLEGEDRIAGLVTGAAYPDALEPIVRACTGLDGPVCDVGAGLGAASTWVAQRAAVTVVAVEPEVDAAALARRAFPGLPVVAAAAGSVSCRRGSAAGATFLGTVSLLVDLDAALADVARIVRPGGVLGITDLALAGARERRDGENDFRSVGALTTALAVHGFEVVDRWEAAASMETEWDGVSSRVDAEIERRHGHTEAFRAWRRDRDHLGELIGDGTLGVATVTAVRQPG